MIWYHEQEVALEIFKKLAKSLAGFLVFAQGMNRRWLVLDLADTEFGGLFPNTQINVFQSFRYSTWSTDEVSISNPTTGKLIAVLENTSDR